MVFPFASGVSASSMLDLKAQLFKAQEDARQLKEQGIDPSQVVGTRR